MAASGAAMTPDLAELLGQSMARRAAEVCAAGGHHLSLLGPPGVGKTMLAERIPTILPRLDPAAALEVTSIHSVAGTLPPQVPLLTDPPFLAPHHTATKAAIVGGGSGIIRPDPRHWRTGGCCSSTRRGTRYVSTDKGSLPGTMCQWKAFLQVSGPLASLLAQMARSGVWWQSAMLSGRGVVCLVLGWACPSVDDVFGVEDVQRSLRAVPRRRDPGEPGPCR